MFKRIIFVVLVISALPALAMSAALPGTSDTVFNKRFIQKLKPMMPYDQLARMAGGPGQKVREDRKSNRSGYHWNGGRRSMLDITVAGGRVVEVTVTAPRRQRFSLGRKGELVAL